jgi:hypothetical protein
MAIIAQDDKLLRLSGSSQPDFLDMNQIVGGWRDLRASLVASAVGAGTPTLTAFGPSGNINQYKFGVGDSVYLALHVDHDIKESSTCYIHVHWSTDGTSTNSVKWQFSITSAERDDTTHDTFSTDTVITVEASPQGSAWEHIVTEDSTGFTIPPVDSVLLCELKRITNGATENSDDVFGLFVDIHYEAQQYGTPNRAPNFYT